MTNNANILLLIRETPYILYELYQEDGEVWSSNVTSDIIAKLEELNELYPKSKIRLVRDEQWLVNAALESGQRRRRKQVQKNNPEEPVDNPEPEEG